MPVIRLLRRPEVEARTGLSRSSIYLMMDKGEFPRPRRIGQRAVAWDEADIENWLTARAIADPHDVHAPRREQRCSVHGRRLEASPPARISRDSSAIGGWCPVRHTKIKLQACLSLTAKGASCWFTVTLDVIRTLLSRNCADRGCGAAKKLVLLFPCLSAMPFL